VDTAMVASVYLVDTIAKLKGKFLSTAGEISRGGLSEVKKN